eukprot:2297468-Amphidinium_carterae.1
MLYLQLPKEGAKNAGERRPIALLPQVYKLWSAYVRADVRAWRQLCKDRVATDAPWCKVLLVRGSQPRVVSRLAVGISGPNFAGNLCFAYRQ